MVDIRLQLSSPPDDDEVAACLAAISYMLQSEASAAHIEQPSAAPVSAWKASALLEGVGRAGRKPARTPAKNSIWRSRQLFSVALVAALFSAAFACDPASAQQFADDPNVSQAPESQAVETAPAYAPDAQTPPYAPPLVRTTDIINRKHSTRGLEPPAVLRPPIPEPAQAPTAAVVANDLADAMPQVWPNGDQQPPKYVRVALGLSTMTVAINLPDGGTLKDSRTGDVLAELPPQSNWRVALRAPNGYSQLSFTGRINNAAFRHVLIASRSQYRNVAYTPGVAPADTQLIAMPPSATPQFWLPLNRSTATGTTGRMYAIVPPQDGVVSVGNKLYRGSVAVCPSSGGGGLNVINYVGLEDYLLSVVPSEMPSSWPLESLKAQAIAARSYVLASLGKHDGDGYDVKPTDEDQVYNGVQSENDNSNRAVAETAGQVMKYDGQVITAYFHSTSGGCTEVAENVWSRPVPYLKAVPDYDDDSPHFAWTKAYSTATVEQILARNGRGVGALLAIVPVARGISPRIRWMMVSGSARSIMLSGEDARRLFNLPSSCFNVGGGSTTYVFAGRGFGHGLGMSQYGAKKLAESGYCAPQILSYYYKDITVDRL